MVFFGFFVFVFFFSDSRFTLLLFESILVCVFCLYAFNISNLCVHSIGTSSQDIRKFFAKKPSHSSSNKTNAARDRSQNNAENKENGAKLKPNTTNVTNTVANPVKQLEKQSNDVITIDDVKEKKESPVRGVIDLVNERPSTTGRQTKQETAGTKMVASAKSPLKKTPLKAHSLPIVPKAVKLAIEKAIDELPEIDPKTIDTFSGSGFGDVGLPPRHGEVDIPSGPDVALIGYTFVFTGLLESLTKDEASDFVKRHSGRVTSAVSGVTDFLVVGTQCGNTKLGQAIKCGTKIINEEGLLSLIRGTSHLQAPPQKLSKALETISREDELKPTADEGNGVKSHAVPNGQLWTEKYRPQSSDELVGHVTIVAQMKHWLRQWDDVHIHGKAATPATGGGSRVSVKYEKPKKAILLCGPPGLGKTTSAIIVSKSLGFNVVEINASDTRNQAEKDVNKGMNGRTANMIKEMVTNKVLGGGQLKNRQVLVMDEVDGLAGNQDRGGVADLIKTIQGSKVPIICICNDKYSMKIRSLRNHCMELDFRKPHAQSVRQRLMTICEKEGLQILPAVLEKLADGCNCDIRLAINNLQMITRRFKTINYDTMKKTLDQSMKDLEMSPFTATGRLFEPASNQLSLNQLQDLAFVDSDLIPLFVQENYLNYVPNGCSNDQQKLFRMVKAADMISDGDLTNKLVRMEQKWNLMPLANILGCVYPARLVSGSRTIFGLYPNEMNFTRFTAFMGNLSSSNKQKRVLGELQSHMLASGSFQSDRTSLRLQYISCMKKILTQPLKDKEKEVMNVMH